MHTKLEDWKNGWFGVELGISKEEIDRLVELLKMVRDDPDQHFHLTSDYKGAGGIGDITIYLQQPDEVSNMDVSGGALAPGETINDPTLYKLLQTMSNPSKSEIGYWVSVSLFFVFCGLSILNSRNSIELTKLGARNIAPENLRSAPESFRLNLAVERHSKEIVDISTSESWKKMERKLAGYADRLELYDKQRERQTYLISAAYLLSAISMVVFGIRRKRGVRASVDQTAGGNTAAPHASL